MYIGWLFSLHATQKAATEIESQSPATHFLKFIAVGKSSHQQHKDWLEDIRQSIWDRIKFKNKMIPSTEALYLHWKTSCWVMHMWRQEYQNSLTLHSITNYWWTLNVVWDTPANLEAIRGRVNLLLRGCKCVTGCFTGRWGCKRSGKNCAGCQCKHCSNLACIMEEARDLMEVPLEEDIIVEDMCMHTDQDTEE